MVGLVFTHPAYRTGGTPLQFGCGCAALVNPRNLWISFHLWDVGAKVSQLSSLNHQLQLSYALAGDSNGSRTLNWVPFAPVVKSIFP